MASLDPRINRVSLLESINELDALDQWQTYEVFHQKSRGEHHVHVGIVHAPSPEMALVFAKEQYARRQKCAGLWVVKTDDIYDSSRETQLEFEASFDKSYREASGYKVRETINQFKKENQPTNPSPTPTTPNLQSSENQAAKRQSFKLKPKQPKP